MRETFVPPFAIAYRYLDIPDPLAAWYPFVSLIWSALALFLAYGFARRLVAPWNGTTRFGLSDVSWRDRGICFAIAAFIATVLWIGFDYLQDDGFLFQILSALPPQHENVVRALLLVVCGWGVWTVVLAEMLAYSLVGMRRRREWNGLPPG
ncbi:MAG TPA: hypothetical protein VE988_22440 [Gemmataceae bacterium]|nr:hypothetical protein [Gemmataceae bacterium]